MSNCDPMIGRQLLAGDLSEADEFEYVRHLDDCAQCRSGLAEDAGDNQTWQAARQLLGDSSEVVHWSSTAAVQETAIQFNRESTTPAASTGLELAFLSPTDDPAFIGRIGGYEISGVIGRGGMGVVFKASDRSLNRNVAVKVLDPSLASIGTARQRFAREARAMAAISHEHVVPIYCVDEHQGLPYFAMEYVAGGTLESRLRSEGPLNVVSVLQIARQVASALSAAHECGLVHRDIKPANILLDPGIDRVRVADFGLARISNDASYTRSGLLAGTPQFMAPEQVRGEACDARSDLFSLGSVIYAMCTGHPPFRAETVYGVMQRIVHDTPRGIREQVEHVPDWLTQFIDRLLSKNPLHRFDTAAEVVQLLESELTYLHRPELRPPPSRKWTNSPKDAKQPPKKSRRAPWLGVVVVVALAVIASALRWTQPPAEPPSIAPAADVALWHSDQFDEALQQAATVESELLQDSARGAYDPWREDVQRIRQRIAEIDASLP